MACQLSNSRPQILERQRLKRMRGGDSDDATDDGLGAPAGGFAARRYKAARAETAELRRPAGGGGGGDDLEDDFDLSGDEGGDDEGSEGEGGDGGGEEGGGGDGDGPLQKRQRRRAAGGDELQSSFRCASARGGGIGLGRSCGQHIEFEGKYADRNGSRGGGGIPAWGLINESEDGLACP